MKIVYILTFYLALQANVYAGKINLNYVRENYGKAVNDKKLCAQLIESLEARKDETVFLAYLGGLQTIWANHVVNPISKFSTFKKGKNNIESAVKQDVNNIEIRFIRLSVQKNAPSFLGYNKNRNEDISFLKKHRSEITSPLLLKMINELLKE